MSDMDITAIQKRLYDFAEARNWQQFHSPKNLTMTLAAEVAELLEIFQWLTRNNQGISLNLRKICF
jgi:NTP pyrophosphatase (non-canonical NTP hydrolase)